MIRKDGSTLSQQPPTIPVLPEDLLEDLRCVIDQARRFIASTVNASLTMSYWHVGNRIRKETLQGERAEYGREIVVSLSRQLVVDYGNSFSDKNLRRMIQFAEIFPDEQIVVSLIRQLSWTHFIALIPIKDPIKRDFYAEMCRIEKWNVCGPCVKKSTLCFLRGRLFQRNQHCLQRLN